MPRLGPDGLGLADTRKSIYGKVKKPHIPSYYNSSANTTKYYGKTTSAPKKVTPPKKITASLPSGSASPFGIGLPGTSTPSSFGSSGDLLKQATQAVHLELDPQVHTLEAGYNQENKDYGYLINTLRKQLGLSKTDINTLYNALDVSLQSNAQAQGKINTATKGDIGKIYDQLSQVLGTSYSGAIGNTNSEMQRLGINDPNATKNLTENQQFQQGTAATNKANSQGLIDAINASTQGQMSLLRGSSASTGALLQSQLQQTFSKESGDALQQHLQKLAEIKRQRDELKNAIPSKINQTYAALLDQQYTREQQAAQQAFDNQIKLGNLQINSQSAASDQQYKQNQLALEAQKIANDAAKSNAQLNAPKTGVEKALTYLNNLSFVKSGAVPFSTLENILIDAVNGDPNRTDYPGYNPNYFGQYSNDIKTSVASRGLDPSIYTDLVNAMNYLFGKV